MANLQSVSITFNTHDDNKNDDTVVHVFVKNRSSDTSTPMGTASFIENLLSYEAHKNIMWEKNPFLAYCDSLAPGEEFKDPSSHTFEIPLRPAPIPLEEVVLPVIDIHILTDGDDRWIFDYTAEFLFEDGKCFSFDSKANDITGIILDQDNHNYSGICGENPFNPQPPRPKPQTNAVLQKVELAFLTRKDNKNDDTKVNIQIADRLNETTFKNIAVAQGLFDGVAFEEDSLHKVVFSASDLPLASNSIFLRDIVLPVVFISIVPGEGIITRDTWIFDYRATYTFSNGMSFSSGTGGVILDENNRKHMGVYSGSHFPRVTPAEKPQPSVDDHRLKTKVISLGYLQKKLDELINQRTETPLWKIRLDHTGNFEPTFRESYFDLQSIVANPPAPGFLSPPGFQEGVRYSSSPTSLGQLTHLIGIGNLFLVDVNSAKLTATVDTTKKTPLTFRVDFETGGAIELRGGSGKMDFTEFFLRIGLTLDVDPVKHTMDVLSWVPKFDDDKVEDGDEIENFLVVRLHTTNEATDFQGAFQKNVRLSIFHKLNTIDPLDGKTRRDRLNETLTSWLVGGSTEGGAGVKVHSAVINGDNLEITYSRENRVFEFISPQNWPAGVDFTPGALAKIDHIIVLTMENRSFDTMLGYLSLPPKKGGMGRKDVDGLKGNEVNVLNGTPFPSFAFQPGETIFTPDPPHDHEPVALAINNGKMDGFVQSFEERRGLAAGPGRIMGYHTAVNVPVYDALARDFAIGHRWFASHPGPTFPNRFYELTGRLNIDPDGYWEFSNSSPILAQFTPTIFDHLSANNVSWMYFERHYCFLRFFANYTFDTEHIATIDDPLNGFFTRARAGTLPSVTFIDPAYIELPPGATADGPPADVQAGQAFVKRIVEAVVTSPKWNKTLLIITYDEHGGFYDHVAPPPAAKVTPESLGTYGVRVPTLVISPWVRGGSVFGHDSNVVGTGNGNTNQPAGGVLNNLLPNVSISDQRHRLYFDHTSILKTIARRFLSQNPPYMGPRYAEAHDLSVIITDAPRPGPFRPFIPYNLLCQASQKQLAVQNAATSPGALLVQDNAQNGVAAQQFSFEDAGNGFFYIRTHTGSLYLTASSNLSVKQDVKYPTDGSAPPAKNPNLQRWKFTSNSISTLDRNNFTISNAAFPDRVLQPEGGNSNANVRVALGTPQGGLVSIHHLPNPWKITSPLLPDEPGNHA